MKYLSALLFCCFFHQLSAQDELQLYWNQALPGWWDQYTILEPMDREVAAATKYGLTALINTRGEALTPFDYFSIYALQGTPYQTARATDQTWRLLDNKGNIILKSDANFTLNDNRIFTSSNNVIKGAYDGNGREISLPVIQKYQCRQVDGNYFSCSEDGVRWGLCDENGKWLVQPQFASTYFYKQLKLLKGYKNGYQYIVNPETGFISQPYAEIQYVSSTFIWAKKSVEETQFTCFNFRNEPAPGVPHVEQISVIAPGKGFYYQNEDRFGILDERNNVVMAGLLQVERTYPNMASGDANPKTGYVPQEPYLRLLTENGWGVWKDNQWIIEPKYKNLSWTTPWWVVSRENETELRTENGALYRKYPYPQLTVYSNGWIIPSPQPDSMWNRDGRAIDLPAGINQLYPIDFSRLFYGYDKNRQYNLIDESGTILAGELETTPTQLYNRDVPHLFQIRRNQLFGWYNLLTHTAVEPQYDDQQMTAVGGILVRKGLFWGIVSDDNKELASFEFTDTKPVGSGWLIALKKGEKWRLFDFHNKVLLPLELDEVESINCQGIWGKTAGNWNIYCQPDWKPTLPLSQPNAFVKYMNSYAGYAIARQNGRYGTVNYYGQTVLPFVWDTLVGQFGTRGDSVFELDNKGRVLHGFKARSVAPLYQLGYAVTDDKGVTFLKKDGSPLNPMQYRYYYPLSSPPATADVRYVARRTDGKYDLLSSTFAAVKTIEADTVFDYTTGFLGVKKGSDKYLLKMPDFSRQPLVYDRVIDHGKGKLVSIQGKLRGLCDRNLREILPPVYSEIEFWGDFIRVTTENKTGLFQKDGSVAIPVDVYDRNINRLGKDLFTAEKNALTGFYSISQNTWTPPSLEDINSCNIRIPLGKSLYWFRQNGLYGIMDEDCKKIIPAEYDRVESAGNYIVLERQGKNNVYYPAAQKFIAQHVKTISAYQDDILFTDNMNWFVYHQDSLLYQGKHAYLHWLYSGKLLLYSNDGIKQGIMLPNGQVQCAPEYIKIDLMRSLEPILLKAIKNNKYGVITPQGKEIIPFLYNDLTYDNRTGIRAILDTKKGLFTTEGKVLLPVVYDDIQFENDDNFIQLILRKNGRKSIVDRNGKLLLADDWDDLRPFNYGMAAVKKNGLWGYVDVQGKLIIPLQYRFAGNFRRYDNRSIATVLQDSTYSTIAPDGVKLADRLLEDTYSNSDRLYDLENTNAYRQTPFYSENYSTHGYFFASTARTDKKGLVNLAGDWALPPKYDELSPVYYSDQIIALVREGDRWGLVDYRGKIVVRPRFETIENIPDNRQKDRFRVKENGLEFVVDEKGEKVE